MAEMIADEIDFAAYLDQTNHKAHVKPAHLWEDDLIARLTEKKNQKGVYLPWEKTREFFEFRRGEVTMWAGQNGHGKSEMTSQIALSLMGQGQRVSIASFEMKPVTTLERMARMFNTVNQYAPEFRSTEGIQELSKLHANFMKWTKCKLWLYDQQGTAHPKNVLGMVKYCADVLKIQHVFIDSLMKCVKGEDDYNGQKSFLDELTAIARDEMIHIHIVHHLRKPSDEYAMPDKHDSKGSGAITDLVDNWFGVWRNKKKEAIKNGTAKAGLNEMQADALLICRKQRNFDGTGSNEPTFALYRHADSSQYLANEGDSPLLFAMYPHEPTTF
jgi:twinkle protein